MNNKSPFPSKHFFFTILLLINFCFAFQYGFCQAKKGIVKGKVIDGTTYRTLFNVLVSSDTSAANHTYTHANGYYQINLNENLNVITYKLEGFQKKIVSGVRIKEGYPNYLDIILYPIATNVPYKYKYQYKDSARAVDSVVHCFYKVEKLSDKYNYAWYDKGHDADIIRAEDINPGTDKNGALLLKRLNGTIVNDNHANILVNSFVINGMGERYNQLMFNGSAFSFFDPLSKAYPLELIPSEAIEEVDLQKTGNSSIPSDFAGGTVEIKIKDYTDKNFYSLQIGTGFSDNTSGKQFYGDKRGQIEFLGLQGKQRNLPDEFPTTRSSFISSTPSNTSPPYNFYNLMNVQEQVYKSKLLNNNLAPLSFGNSKPNERLLAGFGKKYLLKNGVKVSIISFVNHTKNEQIDEATVQVAPKITENPFPFTDVNKQLIGAQSKDFNYRYSSQLAGIINASIIFGGNKISLRNFIGSQFSNVFTQRSGIYKPDEDTLAHSGINYKTTQRYFINSQIAGEHILSPSGKFKMDWQITYTYINQQNPDERNFLLREDFAGSKYQIAIPVTPNSITNSGRLWRGYKDNNFTGALNLSFPFSLFKQPQVLYGGIYIQQNYRINNADLLLVQGGSYTTLNNLLAPERYFPGGVSVSTYYINTNIDPTSVQPNNRANYSANANLGAAFIQYNSRLSNSISLLLGGRIESNSQLVSDIYYQRFDGLQNPQFFPLSENTKVTTNNFLPSANLVITPAKSFKIQAAYFKTVNRPHLQELTEYGYYDASSFSYKTGNPILSTADIDNYNSNINFLFNGTSTLSLGAFYKRIDQPIEYIIENGGTGNIRLQPHNTPPATVKGLQASFKLKLSFLNTPWLSGITVFGNGNIIKSKANGGPIRSLTTPAVMEHTLSGTPNYSVNTGLVMHQYGLPELTILYSRSGDYISALGSGKVIVLANGSTVLAMPNYRVKGREQLDIQLSQKIFKSKIQIIVGANNILDNTYVTYQDLNGNNKFDSPLALQNLNNLGGQYKSGTDNTISNIKSQRTFFVTLSWLFK